MGEKPLAIIFLFIKQQHPLRRIKSISNIHLYCKIIYIEKLVIVLILLLLLSHFTFLTLNATNKTIRKKNMSSLLFTTKSVCSSLQTWAYGTIGARHGSSGSKYHFDSDPPNRISCRFDGWTNSMGAVIEPFLRYPQISVNKSLYKKR